MAALRIKKAASTAIGTTSSFHDRQIGQVISARFLSSFWNIETPEYALEQGPSWLKIDAATGMLSGTPDAAGKFDVAVTATIDRQVRKLDDEKLGWGQEVVLSTGTERVGSATQRFVVEVGP